MARPKRKDTNATLTKFLENLRQEQEENTVGFFWVVIEHSPYRKARTYDDHDIPSKRIEVSKRFDTRPEAEEWLLNHDPDPGNTLYIQKYRTVREIEYRNYPVREKNDRIHPVA